MVPQPLPQFHQSQQLAHVLALELALEVEVVVEVVVELKVALEVEALFLPTRGLLHPVGVSEQRSPPPRCLLRLEEMQSKEARLAPTPKKERPKERLQ